MPLDPYAPPHPCQTRFVNGYCYLNPKDTHCQQFVRTKFTPCPWSCVFMDPPVLIFIMFFDLLVRPLKKFAILIHFSLKDLNIVFSSLGTSPMHQENTHSHVVGSYEAAFLIVLAFHVGRT